MKAGRQAAGVRQDNRECFRFAKQVPAGDSGELTFSIPRDGTIERATLRIYIGAQLDLHITPWLERLGGNVEHIIKSTAGSKKYLDGDDDDFDFSLGVPVYRDEVIHVEYKNNDATNAYDFAFHVEIDFMGGSYRMPVYV